MSLLPIHKTGEATETKKKLKKKGENQEAANVQKNTKDTVAVKKKKKEKQPRDTTYVLKKNFTMKIFRWVFWFMLVCVFARGAYQIIKPQAADELRQMIKDFEQTQQSQGDAAEEVMDFAQDFAKEYLTYEKGGEQDFRTRINPYISQRLNNAPGIYAFRNNAKAAYVNAYRKEQEGEVYNVYVNAEIQYDKGEDGMEYADCTLKIPVVATESGYCITALPMYIQDKRNSDDYTLPQIPLGQEIDTALVSSSIENFLSAYYSQEQSMINYLLTADADRSKFVAIGGRYEFKKVESIKAYQSPEAADILCLLTVRIADTVNQEEISQEYMITLVQETDKYYVKDIDTKIY